MGMAFHADLNKDVISDTLWAVAAYLVGVETAAVVLAVELLAAASPKSGRKKDQ